MKKISFVKLFILGLFLLGCRELDIIQNDETSKKELKISILKSNEIIKNTTLFNEISKIQNEKFSTYSFSKSIQDSVLYGAIISTENVMLVENETQKTYTFPVSRSIKSSKIENLVLKQKSDNIFSGVLIQYDITDKEKELFISGHDIDVKNKIKIFDIDAIRINLNSRVQTDAIGCYSITWETGWCSEGIHSSGNDAGMYCRRST
ncbi:hypothetical protein [Chryseobacterium lineare]